MRIVESGNNGIGGLLRTDEITDITNLGDKISDLDGLGNDSQGGEGTGSERLQK